MKLKDARNILIDNEDVQRIKMFNEVVWEKNKPTKISLTASTTSTSFLNSYTLLATLSEDNDYATPINGVVEFYEDTGNEAILLGKSNTTVNVDDNTATARYTTSTKNIGTHTYYAVFNQNEVYGKSTSTPININVKKDTPKLTLLGDTNIYNTWSIGVKLTNSKGTVLSGRKIQYGNASAYTDSKGKAIFYISGKNAGTLSVTYDFQSVKKVNNKDTTDTEYSNCSLSKKYKILNPTPIESKITKLEQTQTANGKKEPYQKWYHLNPNGISVCGEKNSNYTAIGTVGGTWKKPGPLKATFTKIDGKIFNAKFSYSDSILPGVPAKNGGYPEISGPEITINNNSYSNSTVTVNSSPTKGTPKNGPPNADSYKTHSVSWSNASGDTMSTPTIIIKYPANTGGELGILYLKSLKLTFTYIPTQKAL